MSTFNQTKRELFQGLRKKPSYKQVVDAIIKDVPVKLPNRDATMLRNSMAYSQLDNTSAFESMQEQQGNALREQQKEVIMKQAAINAPSLGIANYMASEPTIKKKT